MTHGKPFMQASGMSEKAYFYPREGSTVFLSPDNVPTRIKRRVALFAHLHVNKDVAPEMYRLPIQTG
jgi:hypothetical protein